MFSEEAKCDISRRPIRIFALDRAYQANVPTEMTEKEFWTKYIQSAYFNRDRGGGDASSSGGPNGTSSAISGNKRRAVEAGGGQDDMFLRFAAQEAEREKKAKEGREGGGAAGGAKRGRSGGAGVEGTEGGNRLEAGSVDPMVDLTLQWGDHHAGEVRRRRARSGRKGGA